MVPQPNDNLPLVRDCSVLLTFKDTLRGTAVLNWSADTSIFQWEGVRRRGKQPQYVGTLYLSDLGLNGTIPTRPSGLRNQRRLDLVGNELTGSIPAALGSLEQRYLFDNHLTGSIPTEFENLRSLLILSLYDNDLTGSTRGAGAALGLWELLLSGNSLTGAFPTGLADLPHLAYLFLEENSCIPTVLRDVASHDLDDLELSDCAAREKDCSYWANSHVLDSQSLRPGRPGRPRSGELCSPMNVGRS